MASCFALSRSAAMSPSALPSASWAGIDQRGEPRLLAAQRQELAIDRAALVLDRLAGAREVGEIGQKRIDLDAHSRHHRTEQHGGADRLQHVLGLDEQRRRRLAAHPLERGQHLRHDGAAALQRTLCRLLARSEGVEPCLGIGDPALGLGHTLRVVSMSELWKRAWSVLKVAISAERRATLGFRAVDFVLQTAQLELVVAAAGGLDVGDR